MKELLDKLENIRGCPKGYFLICINKEGLWDISFPQLLYVGKKQHHFTGSTLEEAISKAFKVVGTRLIKKTDREIIINSTRLKKNSLTLKRLTNERR